MGSIELITGPMYAGKTLELIKRLQEYDQNEVIAIKWKNDTRYSSQSVITSHDGRTYPALMALDEDLDTIYEEKLKSYKVIGIDEGSFFKKIVKFSEMLANKGHIVIVASLTGTYLRQGFNDILNLIPCCEKVTWLRARCSLCTNDASFTKFIREDIPHDGKEVVGGKESYLAVCRTCFFDT